MALYFCGETGRREAVKNHPTLNGIDFLEVLDGEALPLEDRQRTLFVHFLKDLPDPLSFTRDNVLIEGGERVTGIQVENIAIGDAPNILNVEVNTPGDFSIYTLRLVKTALGDPEEPPDGFDRMLAAVEFSFKADCQSDVDCVQPQDCPPEVLSEPEINYLAKDYNSFRQLMLDRMAVLVPDWRERSPADMGIALVELMAYVGDYLSYQQDAVATEAYLGTARSRVSVRRHARLVDYPMHDGCNARVWVHVQVTGDLLLPAGTPLLTAVLDVPVRITPDSADHKKAMADAPEVFETMYDTWLRLSGNDAFAFYTWSDDSCCLPKGATRATIQAAAGDFAPGEVLIFEEVLGAESGQAADADPAHRHAVRLVEVTPRADPVTEPPTDVLDIRWADDDALPFALTVSTKDGTAAAVAWANIVLADHGQTVTDASDKLPLPAEVPPSRLIWIDAQGRNTRESVPARYRPRLARSPVTQAVPRHPLFTYSADPSLIAALDGGTLPPDIGADLSPSAAATLNVTVISPGLQWSVAVNLRAMLIAREGATLNVYDAPAAARMIDQQPREALPAVWLASELEGATEEWRPRRDLLSSGPESADFVLEVENDGTAYIRFGDDTFGKRPNTGTTFAASYRIGNGRRGNVGAETIQHIVTSDTNVIAVRNPLAARGGVEPEAIESVRQSAPFAFRTQERAVTPEDYAEVATRHSQVQRAAATFRWTGSWRTVFLTIDRVGGLPVDAAFELEMRAHMERYRMAGYDLEIDGPHFVALEIEMEVCVHPDYSRETIRRELLALFSNRVLPGGKLGVFHPDNFTFGQTVLLSPLYAAAESVEGITSVEIKKFRRYKQPLSDARATGKLILSRLEIARLDNDPNFPERGVFDLKVQGGR